MKPFPQPMPPMICDGNLVVESILTQDKTKYSLIQVRKGEQLIKWKEVDVWLNELRKHLQEIAKGHTMEEINDDEYEDQRLNGREELAREILEILPK